MKVSGTLRECLDSFLSEEKVRNYPKLLLYMFVDQRTTKALFQAAILLASAFLIGVKDQVPVLFEKEASAYELKFKVEAMAGGSLEDIECHDLGDNEVDCRLAKYKVGAVDSAVNGFSAIIMMISSMLAVFAGGAVASFLLRPLVAGPDSKD